MTKTAAPNTPAGTRVTVTTGTYEGRTGTVLDHNHGTVDNPNHPNHGRAYLMLALDKTGSDFHNPWTRQFVDDIQVNEEAKEPADTDEPVNFDDVQVGDELTFCNRDNGFGGSGGRIIRPGVVTGKTDKTVTVKVTGSNPLAVPTFTLNSSGRGKDVTYGLTARLRAATWNDRQVRRTKKATPATPSPAPLPDASPGTTAHPTSIAPSRPSPTPPTRTATSGRTSTGFSAAATAPPSTSADRKGTSGAGGTPTATRWPRRTTASAAPTPATSPSPKETP